MAEECGAIAQTVFAGCISLQGKHDWSYGMGSVVPHNSNIFFGPRLPRSKIFRIATNIATIVVRKEELVTSPVLEMQIPGLRCRDRAFKCVEECGCQHGL